MIPKCTRHTSVICVVVLLELLRASTSPAQEQPPKAKITVTLSATDRNGRSRGGAGHAIRG